VHEKALKPGYERRIAIVIDDAEAKGI